MLHHKKHYLYVYSSHKMTSKHNISSKQDQNWTLPHKKPIIWHTYRHNCKNINFDHRGHDFGGQNSGQMTSKDNISLNWHQNWTLRHEKLIIWHTYRHTCKNINFDHRGHDFGGQHSGQMTSKHNISSKQHQNWTLCHEKPIIRHTYRHAYQNVNFDPMTAAVKTWGGQNSGQNDVIAFEYWQFRWGNIKTCFWSHFYLKIKIL